jgi:cyclic beta-1,2-glucan synthetase
MARAELLRLIPGASPALCDILDVTHGPLQPPIRSEIFGLQRFAQHGRSLGETHRAAAAARFAPTFFPRLQDNIRALRQAHRYIGAQAATGYDVSPAAEWLLDNFHLIEAQLKEIHEGLPRSYFRALPVLLDEPLAGLPRVYGVAWAFVAHTDGAFDEALLAQFLNAYQETRALSLSEIWALPTTLRVVLVENLRRLAERVAANKAARAAANLLCDQIGSQSAQTLDPLMVQLEQRGVAQVFLAQMAQRLQDLGSSMGAGHTDGQREWLGQALPDPAAMQAQQRADQTADNLSVSNAVRSLRAIGDADWPDLVARTSALMQHMLGSPVFEAEDAATRDQTLHAIEALARRSGRSEVAVAQTLLDLMHGAHGPESADVDVGVDTRADGAIASHWLGGPGRPALTRALGLHEPLAGLWRQAARRLALPVYLGAILSGSFGLVAWLLLRHSAVADAMGVPLWLALLGAALMLFPASEAVIAVINRLISESARPDHLPRLALTHGLQAQHRVLVAIPAMLTDHASTEALVHRLQQHHLANPERHTQFALLTDWVDADLAQSHTDEALLADATQQVDALNRRHPLPLDEDGRASAAPRFILLHRERSFSQTEQRWIGWERKRGKLELLVAALAEGSSEAFIDLGDTSCIAAQTHYIVTLDSDTQLPPGRLRELVGVAAHPHNQPRLDATGRSVVSGYGILQPRIATPLPAPQDVTPYHALFAGQCGIDPYSAATSEVYQDLFGEGTFTGKGLLNVRAMHAVLSGRLPEGQVLSHDLIEGSMARCAAVTDITLIEDAPFHADVAASRVHRWTRGDWQLLPILLAPRRHRLRAVNRWKMTDNLRRSLVAPMSLALLVLALATQMVSPWLALALVLAAFSAGPLLGAVAGLSPRGNDIAQRHYYRQAGLDLARVLWGGLWHLAMLLQHAVQALDAIVRALWRMTVSHRQLLQWTTAAVAQAQAQTGLGALLHRHRREPVLALALLAALWLGTTYTATPLPWLAWPLCLLWAASPVWTWWVSRPRKAHADAVLPAQEQAYLHGIARDSWRLFERCVGADDHHLPPDNLQTDPFDIVAHRTSPTNIGLYLLSVACARQFGWITTPELLRRIEATLDTLDTLPRHRGHFLNWYDTTSLAPLLPMYVSTVDSGNLSGHLLAVAQAGLELAAAPATGLDDSDTAQRLRALAERCERIAWQAEFGFLYHRKRRLFHIGYRVAEQQLDAGFYDLLASESRLTSLLAIAKGDVPVAHWAALGRPFYAVGADTALRSWSGSMFEYLMPTLVLAEPHGSVLRDACHAAIREQIDFATAHAVPWGVSESAYAGRDHTLAYQYAPQGVPRLALRRTPPDELVIAPYATALAAQLDPQRACRNFAALEALGSRGGCGFIEALDFTAARQTGGQGGAERCTPVSTYMAHHQGMSIVALANVLLDGAPQRWGMANAHIEAVASLLHEHAPREVSVLFAPPSAPAPLGLERRAPALLREVLPGAAALEPTHVLGNGRYSVTLRANGAGASRWGSIGITRWRDDALRDEHGSFFYLRGLESVAQPGRLIERLARDMAGPPQAVIRRAQPLASLTQHPAPDPAAQYRSVYHADRVCFEAEWPRLHAHTTVWVSPEDDIEFRKVELRNLSDRVLEIELISAFDITLAEPRADEAHPAFGNLFVSAQWLPAQEALLFERRPRLANEQALQAAHFIASSDPQVVCVRIQTDRQRWLGRNHASNRPLASFDELPAKAGDGTDPDAAYTLDTGLDPVCAISVCLRIAPHGKARLTFATAASDNGGTLRAVIDKYRQTSHVQRASLMSATLTGIRLRALGIGAENFAAVQSLTTALAQTLTRPRGAASVDSGAGVVCDRRLLWRFGISGDRPLILVSAGASQGLGLLRSLGQALRMWAWGGIACDLVVINAEPTSYLMALQPELVAMRERHAADSAAQGGSPSTGLHVLRAEELSGDELSTLHSLARVRLLADGRPLLHHVQEWLALHEQAFDQRHATSTTEVAQAADARGTHRAVPAPIGRFAPAGGEFRFDVSARLRPTRPWINVLSNPAFGAQITEAGSGYSWALNSRMNQLTAWSNDPVADPPSEWFLLQDRKTLQVWSVAPSAWGEDGIDYQVVHGQGFSRISHRRGDLDVTATWCVDARSSVKQVRLQFVNRGPRTLQLRLIGMAEWMMGASRADRGSVHTAAHHQRLGPVRPISPDAGTLRERRLTALLCTQRDRAAGFGDGTAFLALTTDTDEADGPGGAHPISSVIDWTCDRRECFDARGRLVLPDHLGQRSGSGLDPCAALSAPLNLPPGAGADSIIERVFLLGYADSPGAARQLAALAAGKPATQREDEVGEHWERLLGATTVKTPDPLFDAMVNRWLLYQTVTCRLWAKAGFYQAGGATGFRDQLQDAMALVWAAPATLREQIVVCAARQFAEGDVQHWWHAPGGAGVRTHFSDDLLWLPHACVHYLRSTGDAGLLNQQVAFLEGASIPDGAEDIYETPRVSEQTASVYEHAARTIDRSLRVGVHGLPLMGSGDWNDGMNRVGHEGRGESVWLAWFLCALVADFAPLAQGRGETERARRWEDAATGWKAALTGPAWDGAWFKRAFFDDGQPLGSHVNTEARIDLIAQAWAVLADAVPRGQQNQALRSMDALLVDTDAGLIHLLDPPLAHAVPSAGYIQAYPPGVRENGGQYSHAGVWALMAHVEAARRQPDDASHGDTAWRYFTWLCPAHRSADPTQGPAYRIEPYVMAGDVYTELPYVGRGGWSWYTGSAAWMHRAAIESLFGLRQGAKELSFTPCLPSHWPQAELTLRRDGRTLRFVFRRPAEGKRPAGAHLLHVGEALDWSALAGEHSFVIELPQARAPAPPSATATLER